MPNEAPLNATQMFRPFLPMVEIKKVTLETDREEASSIGQTAWGQRWYEEKLKNLNPHIAPTWTANFENYERGAEASLFRSGGDFEAKTRVILDLAISVPQGSSILDFDEIINSLNIYVKFTDSSTMYEESLSVIQHPDRVWNVKNLLPSEATMGGNQISETLPDGRRVITYPLRIDDIDLLPGQVDNLGIVAWSAFNINELARNIRDIFPAASPAGTFLGANLLGLDFTLMTSQRTGLLVFENGRIVSKSQLFRLSNGEIWEGPVHHETLIQNDLHQKIMFFRSEDIEAYRMTDSEINDRVDRLQDLALSLDSSNGARQVWMTGIGEEPGFGDRFDNDFNPRLWGISQMLRKESVTLPRVQDFRTSMDIENLEFDFSFVENNALAAMKKDLRNTKLDIAMHESYFSELFLSRDIDDYARFFFSMDWRRTLVENTVFGKLFSQRGGTQLERLLNESDIMSLRIYRHRVEGSSEIGSTPTYPPAGAALIPSNFKPKPFDENQIDKMIIETKTARGSGFVGIESVVFDPGFEESDGGVSEISTRDIGITTPSDSMLRHFQGVDAAISEITDGYYQYRIEFEILDKSIDIVDNMRVELDEYIQDLKWYYNEATKLERVVNTSVTPDGSPYLGGEIAGRTETIFIPGEIQTGKF